MDISELLPYGIVIPALVSLFAVFVIAERVPKRWLRMSVRVVVGGGILLAVLVLMWLVIGDCLTKRDPLLYSPDGKHIAIVTWDATKEFATVEVRHRYSPFSKSVYSGPGLSGGIDPQVRWIENNRLLVRYDEWNKYDRVCIPHALGVEIICEHPLHYIDQKSAIAYGDKYYSELKQRQVDHALAMYTEKRGDEWRRVLTDLDRQKGGVTDFKAVDWEAMAIGPFRDSTDLECVRVKYQVTRNDLVSQETLLVCPHQHGADWGIAAQEIIRNDTGQRYNSHSTVSEEKTFSNK
jgi:hypothetical protein